MATASTLISMAQGLLLDTGAAVWSAAGLLVYFNRVQQDFGFQALCLVKEASQAVSVPASLPQEYSLPVDLVALPRLEFNGERLDEVSTQDLDRYSITWETDTGAAASVYARDGRLSKVVRLWPASTGAASMQFRYFALPASLIANTSTSDLPGWVHHYLMLGLVAEASGDEGDLQDAARSAHCKERFDAGVNLVRELLV